PRGRTGRCASFRGPGLGPRRGGSESGVTIVAILLGLLLTGIAIAVFTSGLSGHLRANRKLRAADSSSEVETVFKDRVHELVADFVEDTLCGMTPSTPAAFENIDWTQVSPSLDVKWIKTADVNVDFNYSGDALHSAAIDRCKTAQTFSAGNE